MMDKQELDVHFNDVLKLVRQRNSTVDDVVGIGVSLVWWVKDWMLKHHPEDEEEILDKYQLLFLDLAKKMNDHSVSGS